jgi:large subunit ribosomal protein L23
MNSPYDIIKTLIQTEKGVRLEGGGTYQFIVANTATKIDIRRAVEKVYKVKVEDVNTVVVRGKIKRVRQIPGKQPDWKKAYVRLAAGQKIEIK